MARGRKTPKAPPVVGFYTGPLTSTAPAGFSGRKGKRPGADKGQRGWNTSPYYKNAVTVDSRWSATVNA